MGRDRSEYFRNNNFDLVRLTAAIQVVMGHAVSHLHLSYSDSPLFYLSQFLPGVPAFFFVSGFLISASWERNPDVRTYSVNRFLRITPALWVVFAFSVATVLIFFKGFDARRHIFGLAVWAVSQLSIVQVYNPSFLRNYGVGVVNGSLWTIPIEMIFYALVPLIYRVMEIGKAGDKVLIAMTIISFAALYLITFHQPQATHIVFMLKAISVTPIPWLGMFCVGILAQRHIGVLYPIVAGRFPLFLGLYVGISAISYYWPIFPILKGESNALGILNYVSLVILILSAAYSWRGFADKILHRNDLSYGIYIYHMPIINVLVASGIVLWNGFVLTILLTWLLATFSWFLIEKNALELRHRTLYWRGDRDLAARAQVVSTTP